MTTALSLSGVVLAGGRSTRMGREKALIEVEGVALWRRHYNFLAEVGAVERAVSVRGDQTWLPEEVARVNDAEADLGPLSGMAAALAHTRQEHVLVLAVDMPNVSPAWVVRLCEGCASGVGAVGRSPQGFFEPLAAIYPRELLADVQRALAARELSLQRLISRAVEAGRLRVCPIATEEMAWFANWNDPQSLS